MHQLKKSPNKTRHGGQIFEQRQRKSHFDTIILAWFSQPLVFSKASSWECRPDVAQAPCCKKTPHDRNSIRRMFSSIAFLQSKRCDKTSFWERGFVVDSKSHSKIHNKIPAKSTDVVKNGVATSTRREEGPECSPLPPLQLNILSGVIKNLCPSNRCRPLVEHKTLWQSDLFSHRFREGISFPNAVERFILKLPLSKVSAVPLALQNRALFEGAKKSAEKREGRRVVAKRAKRNKGHVKTDQASSGECVREIHMFVRTPFCKRPQL